MPDLPFQLGYPYIGPLPLPPLSRWNEDTSLPCFGTSLAMVRSGRRVWQATDFGQPASFTGPIQRLVRGILPRDIGSARRAIDHGSRISISFQVCSDVPIDVCASGHVHSWTLLTQAKTSPAGLKANEKVDRAR
jgi:hypothetical protein